MKHRALLAFAAGLLALGLSPAFVGTAQASPVPKVAAAATINQCTGVYAPVGSNPSFATWFWGRTTVRFRNDSGSGVIVQWWAGSSGQVYVAPHSSYDLTASFAGLRFSTHIAGDYGSGVWISFPIGPC